MKSLQDHLMESMINEAYKPDFKPQDWEKVLKDHKSGYSNYSQLGGLESYIDDGDNDPDVAAEWIETMIEGGVKDEGDNRDILNDIFMWAVDHYSIDMYGWRDDAETIMDRVNNMDPGEWAVSEEDYARFAYPTKKLTGADKKYGEILAKYGESGDVANIASQYGGDNW